MTSTDPSARATDLETLDRLAALLHDLCSRSDREDGWSQWRDTTGAYRLLVPSWSRLEAAAGAEGVGFFGELRPTSGDEFPPHLEPAVADGAAGAGWLLAYFNARFTDLTSEGAPRYGNLVIVTEHTATSSLLHDASHVDAVERACSAYRSVRIHRLTLSGPPARQPTIAVRETLSLDYDTVSPSRIVATGNAM